MTEYSRPTLRLYDGFDDDEWLLRDKGYLCGVRVDWRDTYYLVDFYDPVRLSQSVEPGDPPRLLGVNVVVVPEVSRLTMQKAMDKIATSGQIETLRERGDKSGS